MNSNPFDIFEQASKQAQHHLEDLARVMPVIKLVGDICENICPSYGHNDPEVVIREDAEDMAQIVGGINDLLSVAFGKSVDLKAHPVEIVQLD